jgi:hypothetical protein
LISDVAKVNQGCCPDNLCTLQSEEVMLAPLADQLVSSSEQTTAFMDSNVGESIGESMSPLDYELADAQTTADLASFLSRPVRIATQSWDQSTAAGAYLNAIDPWQLFANNSSIKNKLSNFAFLRGTLKVKVITNGSPFLYGLVRATYRPMHAFKRFPFTGNTVESLVTLSQLPGAYITPAHSEGVVMTLPFIWPRSFLRVGVSADFTNMGRMHFGVFAALASANGATSSVTVQVYAWMEDVVLAGPTLAPALQSDEYGVGVVSAPASAIASIAHKFVNVPTIGRFAKATEIGASATSKIAKLFGFTNVPVIEDTKPVRNAPFPSIASAEVAYPNDVLALDPKNELSIDPAIVGRSSEDELAISNFVTKESFLAATSWSTSSDVDTPLFTSNVLPQLGWNTPIVNGASTTVGNKLTMTPMALLGALFANWRGDITFRFKFVASPFHKGRVRISYDPYSGVVQNTGDTGPYVFNKIVDLGAETDVEFTVPYQQALPWCYTRALMDSADWSTSTSPSVSPTDTFTNGVISVKVLTTLTAPVSSSSITMLVYVKGSPNLQFANPRTGNYDLSPFALQADEYREARGLETVMGEASVERNDKRNLVNFGESVVVENIDATPEFVG